MFSGIVVAKGEVKSIEVGAQSGRLSISARDFMAHLTKDGRVLGIGESVMVSGVCLSVVRISGADIDFDLASETLRRTTFQNLRPGAEVNLEPSLRLSDILSGHLVAGHIDAVGTLSGRKVEGETLTLVFSYPAAISQYLAEKGSISIDGVSLTLGEVSTDTFATYIVPHTAMVTTLGDLAEGDTVNLEVDLIARYVERMVRR